jgi:sigma-B regulation protein RsbU (phosphoserine phosphatase)
MLAAHAELNRELQVVGEIQRSLLPGSLPQIPGFDLAAHYQPCALAGGDYFDVVPLAGDVWGLVMADVSGHGVSATVIMAVMRALVHAYLPYKTRDLPSNKFLEFINRQMSGIYTPDGRFVTAWAAILNQFERTLTYASAGHNPPRLVRGETVISLDQAGGLPLGIDESATYDEITVKLEPRDVLAIYTDGFTEAMRVNDGKREYFGTDGLDQVLIACRPATAEDCVKQVTAAVTDFTKTNIPTDDQTLLVIVVD